MSTDSELTFVFRIVYSSAEDIGDAKVTLDIGDYATVTDGTYLEFSISSTAELYIAIPSDVASILVYNVDGYTRLTPVEMVSNDFKKYLFETTSAKTYTLYIHADNADYFTIVLLPLNENSDIIINDAMGNEVETLLNSNTYSFEWSNNGITVPNTIYRLDFLVNDVVRQPNNIIFGADEIGDSVTVVFRLFDRVVREEFTIEKVYDLNIELDVITDDVEEDSDTDVNPT